MAKRLKKKDAQAKSEVPTTPEPAQVLLEKLQVSETRYRRLFETAQDGILLLDAKTGEITDLNPFLLDLLGYPYGEIIGKKLWDIGPFVDRATVKQAFEKLRKDRHIRYEDLPLQTATGTRIRVESVCDVYPVGGRDVIQCDIRDITEREAAEQDLAESELKYRHVVENASEAIFVVQGARIVFVNPMALTTIGYSREEIMARPFTEFIHADDREMVLERHTSRLKGEDVPPVYGFRIVRGDGAVRWVELNAVLIDWQGEPATLNFLRDTTDRKKAEQENEILARFPAENPNPVLRVAKDGEILYANPPSEPLLRQWKAAKGGYVPADWLERIAANALRPSGSEVIEVKCADRVYSIVAAPASAGYVNLYGRDVTEVTRAETERERLLEQHLVLNRITLSLGALMDLRAILRTLHAEVRALLDADGFFVSRYQKDTELITALFIVNEGVECDVGTFPSIPLAEEGKETQSTVLRTGRPLNIRNWIERERTMQTVYHTDSDGSLAPVPPEDEREGCTKSAVLVPMMLEGEPMGVLQVQSNRLNAYSDEDVALLEGVASVAAVSIQNALFVEEIRDGLEGTIEALARTTEMRDPYTSGHQQRVSQLACAIAGKMGLDKKTVDGVRVSGLLHDVGKVSIPAEILSKPGGLTPLEFDLVKEHVRVGFDVLKGIVFPWPVADIVLQHHERIDGSGYPAGLKGEAIRLEARILAVADVVEAMASHRPYRPALGIDAALQEIRDKKGTKYDAEAVEACLRVFESGYTLAPAE